MSSRTSALLAAAGALAVLAGCSSTEPGVAVPASQAAPSATGSALPHRVKDLPLTGADPCKLLTEAQLDELKVNGLPSQTAPGDRRDGPTCMFRVDAAQPFYSYAIETVTSADLQDWLTGKHKKQSLTKEPVDVPGFPALKNFRDTAHPLDCETLVGVAPGQTLRVQMAPLDNSFTLAQMCDMATTVAKMAVQTLAARQ